MSYNYFESVLEDVRNNLEYYPREEGESLEEYEERLNDEMWTDDSITGNGSGSYTFSTYKAEENLLHNFDEIEKVASAFGEEPIISDGYEHGAEWWDVTIRCYYLSSAIAQVIEAMVD